MKRAIFRTVSEKSRTSRELSPPADAIHPYRRKASALNETG